MDAADYPALKAHRWCAVRKPGRSGIWRAVTSIGGKGVLMHRFLMAPPPGMVVDHRDGNGLHNWRANMRVCTCRQNAQNRTRVKLSKTSRYLGVSGKDGRWRAQIGVDGKILQLGEFRHEDEAAEAYADAAFLYFGEFASPLAGIPVAA